MIRVRGFVIVCSPPFGRTGIRVATAIDVLEVAFGGELGCCCGRITHCHFGNNQVIRKESRFDWKIWKI